MLLAVHAFGVLGSPAALVNAGMGKAGMPIGTLVDDPLAAVLTLARPTGHVCVRYQPGLVLDHGRFCSRMTWPVAERLPLSDSVSRSVGFKSFVRPSVPPWPFVAVPESAGEPSGGFSGLVCLVGHVGACARLWIA